MSTVTGNVDSAARCERLVCWNLAGNESQASTSMMKSIHLAVKTLKTFVYFTSVSIVSIEVSAPALAQMNMGDRLVSHSPEDYPEDYFEGTGQTEAPNRNGGGTHCLEHLDRILSTSWENSTDEVRQNQPEEHLDDRRNFEGDGNQQCGDRNRVSGGTR